ncbi:MAG: hypothetical protein ACLF0P_15195 [Thermoanaerobaculia bacterium]
MASSDPERSADLQELVRELRPEIVEVLATHRVPEDAAAQILHDTLIALTIRWNRVTNHRAWIVSTLEARCRAWADQDS